MPEANRLPLPFAFVLLAGGKSSRAGQPKGLFCFDGKPWLRLQVDRLREVGASPILIVGGYHGDLYRELVPDAPDCRFVQNPAPERGQFSSLRVGLRHVLNHSRIGVSLLDVPCPGRDVFARLTEALADHRAAIPRYRGRGGHPVFFSAAFATELCRKEDPTRLDFELAALPSHERLDVEVDDDRITLNLNTREAFEIFFARQTEYTLPKTRISDERPS